MVNPKYADLPGIAYDQPDVYETSDLPEVDQSENLYDEDPENECIERLHISAKDAFSKFRGKYLTGNVDFSDRLSKRIRTGYDARSGEWELAAEGEKETPFQKFHRLQCETRELFEELTVLQQNEKDVNKGTYEDMVAHVAASQKLIESLQLQEDTNPKQITNLNKLNEQIKQLQLNEANKTPETSSKSKKESTLMISTKIADLMQRLHELESKVGVTPERLSRLMLATGRNTLMEAAQVLSSRVSMLQSPQLDQIDMRLGFIGSKMDSIITQQGGAQAAEKDQKIIELYDHIKKSEDIYQLVPDLLERMQALTELHKEASNFTKSLAELETLQKTITTGVQNNKALLQGVQEVFASSLQNINTEIAKLDERLNKISKK
ncbi:dynactin subunit 2-like [Ctenocephalides felis]|uniref:dynactin subunit 2-like n=1 Tax=Ctenocephalides felis TaxID=7515 RepID=UPI000E6E14A5|nr:dynactin subunit 2-like [Ctenocephalides felis]